MHRPMQFARLATVLVNWMCMCFLHICKQVKNNHSWHMKPFRSQRVRDIGMKCAVGGAAHLAASISQPMRAFNCFRRVAPRPFQLNCTCGSPLQSLAMQFACVCVFSLSHSCQFLEKCFQRGLYIVVGVAGCRLRKPDETKVRCWHSASIQKKWMHTNNVTSSCVQRHLKIPQSAHRLWAVSSVEC